MKGGRESTDTHKTGGVNMNQICWPVVKLDIDDRSPGDINGPALCLGRRVEDPSNSPHRNTVWCFTV